MSEDVARAVGAPAPEPEGGLVIAGKPCTVRPLTLKELGVVERACLKQYQRSVLQTYSENLDLLPETDRAKTMRDKLEEISKWDIKDLPLRRAYDVDRVVVNDAVLRWLYAAFDTVEVELAQETDEDKRRKLIQRVVGTCLDDGTLLKEQYEAMTGSLPRSMEIGYVNWWVTACYEGRIEMLYMCFAHSGITRDELLTELSLRPEKMIDITREIESLTSPRLGKQ
jgi:hypothetical protein